MKKKSKNQKLGSLYDQELGTYGMLQKKQNIMYKQHYKSNIPIFSYLYSQLTMKLTMLTWTRKSLKK